MRRVPTNNLLPAPSYVQQSNGPSLSQPLLGGSGHAGTFHTPPRPPPLPPAPAPHAPLASVPSDNVRVSVDPEAAEPDKREQEAQAVRQRELRGLGLNALSTVGPGTAQELLQEAVWL